MVGDEDGRARRQVLLALDLEVHAGRQPHEPLEAAARGPLRDAAVAAEPQDDGGDDAVGGAEQEREVGRQTAGVEAGLGEARREGEQGGCAEDVGEEDVEDAGEDRRHYRSGWRRGRPPGRCCVLWMGGILELEMLGSGTGSMGRCCVRELSSGEEWTLAIQSSFISYLCCSTLRDHVHLRLIGGGAHVHFVRDRRCIGFCRAEHDAL